MYWGEPIRLRKGKRATQCETSKPNNRPRDNNKHVKENHRKRKENRIEHNRNVLKELWYRRFYTWCTNLTFAICFVDEFLSATVVIVVVAVVSSNEPSDIFYCCLSSLNRLFVIILYMPIRCCTKIISSFFFCSVRFIRCLIVFIKIGHCPSSQRLGINALIWVILYNASVITHTVISLDEFCLDSNIQYSILVKIQANTQQNSDMSVENLQKMWKNPCKMIVITIHVCGDHQQMVRGRFSPTVKHSNRLCLISLLEHQNCWLFQVNK